MQCQTQTLRTLDFRCRRRSTLEASSRHRSAKYQSRGSACFVQSGIFRKALVGMAVVVAETARGTAGLVVTVVAAETAAHCSVRNMVQRSLANVLN